MEGWQLDRRKRMQVCLVGTVMFFMLAVALVVITVGSATFYNLHATTPVG